MKVCKSSLLLFSMVFVSVLSLTLVRSVYAWTIIDNPTGGDCSSIGKWRAKTKTCTLNTDLVVPDIEHGGIVIDSDKITLQCNGHSVNGVVDPNGTVGIDASGRKGVTIRECIVTGFGYGFNVSFSDNATLTINTAFQNYFTGIYLVSSNNATLKNNTVTVIQQGFGIYLDSSNNNTLNGNTVYGNHAIGILLYLSNNNTLNGNTANGNWGWAYAGIELDSSNNNILKNNTASQNTDYGIVLNSSNNNTLRSNTASQNFFTGIILGSSNNNTLNGNTASQNVSGIVLGSSVNNMLKSNTADNNGSDYFEYGYGYEDNNAINNIYDGNECSGNWSGGSNPAGLCSPQP